jgi:hypothetical protein
MKKLYFIVALLLTGVASEAQTFWTENFGTGCSRGQTATSYTSANGSWTMAATGTNDSYANTWFISATCAGTGAGNCSSSCNTSSATDASLHLSNVAIIIPGFLSAGADTGASYFSGGLCGFGYCALTNRRIESPTINCSGKSNISISFVYLENGDGVTDDASFCYSANNGGTWTTIDPLAKTAGSCATAGQWTTFTITLPASADNNASVKIGFTWTNNDDGTGSDPSFAVDDIALSETSTGITAYSSSGISVFAKENGIVQVNANGQAYKVRGIYNMLGQESQFTQAGDMLYLEEKTQGIYFINLDVQGTHVSRKVFVY